MAANWEEVMQLPDKLAILPFRNGVLLPGAIVRIRCTSPASVRLVEQELWQKDHRHLIGIVPASDQPWPSSLPMPKTDEATQSATSASATSASKAGSKSKANAASEDRGATSAPGDPADFQQPLGSLLTTEPLHFHNKGVAARALHVSRESEPRSGRVVYSVVLEGRCRFALEGLNARGPYHTARVRQLDCTKTEAKMVENDREVQVLAAEFKAVARQLIAGLEQPSSAPPQEKRKVSGTKVLLETAPVQRLADLLASAVESEFAARLAMLDAVDLRTRLTKATELLARHIQIAGKGNLGAAKRDSSDTAKGKAQRTNQDTLPGVDGMGEDDDDLAALERKLETAGMPPNVWKHAQRELRRLRKMQAQSPGYSSARQYVELLADLPWARSSEGEGEGEGEAGIDLAAAKARLDEEHFGLAKVKKRIVEYIAVRKLKPDATGPVLCFVGPPGVGKTSLASSIASALGRRFVRIALGGVKDEADIRGHRRTYIGSMPGRLIEGIKRVGVNNPVMLLDEIDKTGADARGDPAAALLEVLDPEQNKNFADHYLSVPFDLSKVVFVATANRVGPIPAPLLDRMEVIELPGYTPEEKHRIAVRHLIPRVLEQNGITKRHLQIPEHTVDFLIQGYTREAGVRNLSRHLSALARAAAVQVAESRHSMRLTREIAPAPAAASEGFAVEGAEVEMEVEAVGMQGKEVAEAMVQAKPLVVDEELLETVLGPPRFDGNEAAERVAMPGVAVGLVWTAVGGEVQFVEATLMWGKGDLHLTGQLGEVIKESAQIALTWVRSRAADLASSEKGTNLMDNRDIHIHFPAGAVPKDGPSAGVTLVTALVSLLTRRCVRSDTAMTGELTLRGLVLPVGGVKEKILAAHRCGIRRVILPHKNIKDLQEVPAAILACMEILPTKRVEEVLNEAFEGGCPVKPQSKM